MFLKKEKLLPCINSVSIKWTQFLCRLKCLGFKCCDIKLGIYENLSKNFNASIDQKPRLNSIKWSATQTENQKLYITTEKLYYTTDYKKKKSKYNLKLSLLLKFYNKI